MKLEDIRLGQKLTVSHIPEYIATIDGSKMICNNILKNIISKHIGEIGVVKSIRSFSDAVGIELLMDDSKNQNFYPIESLTAPQHFPVNNDVQVGDFVTVLGSDNILEILELNNNIVKARCIDNNNILHFENIYVTNSIRPAPKKDQLTIGAACVTTPDAVDMNHGPIPNKLGRIEHIFRFDNSTIIRWPNKQFSCINRKYVIQL